MPLSYQMDEQLIRITASGQTSGQDWIALLAKKQATGEGIGRNILFDFSGHDSVVPTDLARQLAYRISPMSRPVRWAFVVSRPVSVGMVNMIAGYLAEKNVIVRSFESREQAEVWVAEAA